MAKTWGLIKSSAFGAVVRSVDYYWVTKLNICIGSDLDGQVIDLKKAYFKAKEVQDSSPLNIVNRLISLKMVCIIFGSQAIWV